MEGNAEPVCVGDDVEDAVFFPNLRVSYVDNLLRGEPDRIVLTARDEAGLRVQLTRADLRRKVRSVAAALRSRGVGPGDRVVAIARNVPATVIACLGTLAVGATWSSAAPDFGAEGLCDRFEQLAPKAVFAHTSFQSQGRLTPIADKLTTLLSLLPSVTVKVSLDAASELFPLTLEDLLATPDGDEPLRAFPWNHPLFILFSSGTTGKPKCIMHGAGGTFLEHHKEHRLHTDLGPSDKIYFHTSCGWMMWNWLVSALACGSEIVLYDGSPTFPEPDSLWRLASEEKVTVFGTSPTFLHYSRSADLLPAAHLTFDALRAVLSTGSILDDPLFYYVRDALKPVPLQSVSGGTDILGCFLLGHPQLPVHAGELQATSLGLDVRAVTPDGAPCAPGEIGELVCANPFPSRPLGLYGDEKGERFHAAYFAGHAGVWTHGDLLELTENGGARIHGRSDDVLNVRGVRIGPSEIARALSGVEEIADLMAIEQDAADEPGGTRLVLLVVLREGIALDAALSRRIKLELSARASPAHVPAVIADVADLPTTHSGKKSERAARDAVNGRQTPNLNALRNPQTLHAIAAHGALQMDREVAPMSRPKGTVSAAPVSREQVEHELLAVWKKVLRLQHVELDDRYFDLGGDSLTAVRLLYSVEAKLGVRLQMSSLLTVGGSIRGMARLITGEVKIPQRSTMVPIQIGTPERRPVFWVPGGGGLSVLAFRQVSEAIGSQQTIYGFEASLESENEPSDVGAIADRYISSMRAVQAHGPYQLLGFSSGGWVAYEMGIRLVRAGEPVGLLVLLDPSLPLRLSRRDRVRTIAQRAAYYAKVLRRTPPMDMVASLRESVVEPWRERFRDRVRPRTIGGEETAFDRIDRQNRESVRRYQSGELPRYPGTITVILAEKNWRSGLSPDLDARLAVSRYVDGGIAIRRVSASHLSMLERPHAAELAAILRDCLDEARSARAAVASATVVAA